jgi:hypothetical protein
MSDAFLLPSNLDLDQSRTSDYDMLDEEDEGDDREIYHSSPQVTDLSIRSDNQWHYYFARSMIQKPPLLSCATASAITKAIRASTAIMVLSDS